MPPLPPTKDVLDALHHTALPAAAGAALVMAAFLSLGRWAAALGAATAVAVGFGWANYTFDVLSWLNTTRVIPWYAEDGAPAWHGLPRAAAFLLVVGLISRWLGLLAGRLLAEKHWWGANLFVWAARVGAVAVVVPGLVPDAAAGEHFWLRPALMATMLALWVALDGIARDTAGTEVTAYLAAAFVVAGAVLLYAHSARFMDVAVMCGCAAAGVAVAAFPTRADTSGAVPLGVVGLPTLMLHGRLSLDSQVPVTSFALVALAPLALLPFFIPAVARQPRWVVIPLRALLVLAPLVAAVVLAAQHEKLAFDEEW
jgi:hypothetical protein